MRREFLTLLASVLVVLGVRPACAPVSAADKRPNILFILVDDLGKEWVSCYGAEDIRTPNVDRLAATGMRFENAYSMPQCTPTRVTLLTGRYPFRNGWVNHWDVPRWGVGYFDWKCRQNMTWARLLREAGYATAAAGKWQINDFRLTPDALRKHGFDEWCMWTGYESGNPPSARRYWDPYINTPEGSRTYEGRFGPDVFCEFLMDFMERHKDQPMALYYPMVLTHGPLTTTPLAPKASGKLERHKAMVEYVDYVIGRLVAKLEELSIRDRTIVILSTDNGSGGGLVGHRLGHAVRGGKGKISEAGCCEPFIVSCPGLVPSGVVTDALTDFTDLFPTFCELAGVRIPSDLKLDGVSIAPVILGRAKDSPRQWILAMGHGAARVDEKGVRGVVDFAERAIRDKRYKVWVNSARQIERLYDLKTDPFEERNLVSSTRPEHVAALKKFQKIVDSLPKVDARPCYQPRAANPWDRKAGRPGSKRPHVRRRKVRSAS